MKKEEGITALRELGFTTVEIDEFIRVETRKREDAAKIIRNMSL
jgi:Holliday junction resolvasome RuvABC DNA-binding subunit